MNVSVVRSLAMNHGRQEIAEAILAFEKERTNLLHVSGDDESEILSHLLAAEFVRDRMDRGLELNAAIREYAQRVKSMIATPSQSSSENSSAGMKAGVTRGDPEEGGKVSPEEAARIQSGDLPTGEPGLTGWVKTSKETEKKAR